jgi:hypothetical protein
LLFSITVTVFIMSTTCTGGVMVSVLASGTVDRGFEP